MAFDIEIRNPGSAFNMSLYSTAVSSIKQVLGITQANIKSVLGVTIANIKSILGVSNIS